MQNNTVLVEPLQATSPPVRALLDQLTVELAQAGYGADETFGYSVDQLEQKAVFLVGARIGELLVGIGGVELQSGGFAELKRFYVAPDHRGTGIAAAILAALTDYARINGAGVLRLETGDKQHAAIAFYRRHGFADIPRFGPYVRSATSLCMQLSLAPQ
jgi:putative acetyltransferase